MMIAEERIILHAMAFGYVRIAFKKPIPRSASFASFASRTRSFRTVSNIEERLDSRTYPEIINIRGDVGMVGLTDMYPVMFSIRSFDMLRLVLLIDRSGLDRSLGDGFHLVHRE